MKRLTVFLSLFLIMGLAIIIVFSIKPKAYMNTDYKHIDDINYIAVNHNFNTFTTHTKEDEYGSYFGFNFGETSDIYGLPNVFETVSQVGSFNIYFNSNKSFDDFEEYQEIKLTISNDGGFSYEYEPFKVFVLQVGSVYQLMVDFESSLFQELDINNNYWDFDFKIYLHDLSTGDYINVLNNYGVENQSNFKWFYYKDYDSNIGDYWKGYTDGRADGIDEGYGIGYTEGYDNGYDNGLENGIITGKEIGYTEGYYAGINDVSDHSFYGLIGQVFMGIGSFLSIELLPNITFGAILSVPLVFGVISFIIGKRGGKDD